MDGGYVLKVMVNRWVFNIHAPTAVSTMKGNSPVLWKVRARCLAHGKLHNNLTLGRS